MLFRSSLWGTRRLPAGEDGTKAHAPDRFQCRKGVGADIKGTVQGLSLIHILVEEPGLNSHAAIAGKALLKPTVVGAAGATSHIRDGLMIRCV